MLFCSVRGQAELCSTCGRAHLCLLQEFWVFLKHLALHNINTRLVPVCLCLWVCIDWATSGHKSLTLSTFISNWFLVRGMLSLGVPQIEVIRPAQNFTWQEVKQQIWTYSSVSSLCRSCIVKFMLLVFTINFRTTLVFSQFTRHEGFFFGWMFMCVHFNSFEPKQLVQITSRRWEPQSWHASIWLVTPVDNTVEFLNATDFIYVCNMW